MVKQTANGAISQKSDMFKFDLEALFAFGLSRSSTAVRLGSSEPLWVLGTRFITAGASLVMRPFNTGPSCPPLISGKHLP